MRKIVITTGLLLLTSGFMFSLGLKDSLDLKFFYTHEAGIAFLQSLGADQSQVYIYNEIIDLLVFIPVYTSLLCFGLLHVFPQKNVYLLGLLPAPFDSIETANILWALKTAPENLFSALGIFTALKWSFVVLAVIVFFWGVLKNAKNNARH